jgi:hypothetical protein
MTATDRHIDNICPSIFIKKGKLTTCSVLNTMKIFFLQILKSGLFLEIQGQEISPVV